MDGSKFPVWMEVRFPCRWMMALGAGGSASRGISPNVQMEDSSDPEFPGAVNKLMLVNGWA